MIINDFPIRYLAIDFASQCLDIHLGVDQQKINGSITHSLACIFYDCSLGSGDALGEQVDLFGGELEIDYWEAEGVGVVDIVLRLGMLGTMVVVLRREGAFGRVFH